MLERHSCEYTLKAAAGSIRNIFFELEEQIQRQCFPPGIVMGVTLIERFYLSEQYTPENFMEVYRSSMELELKNYNMLEYNLFKRAQTPFRKRKRCSCSCPLCDRQEKKVRSCWSIFIRFFANGVV